MDHLVFAGSINDYVDGVGRQILDETGAKYAVFKVKDSYFAFDDTCTHGKASLANGAIEDHVVICPFHSGGFCVRTGKALIAPCTIDINTYDVQEIDGKLYISLDEQI